MASDPQPEGGLYTPDELATVKRVERSRVWRLLRDALCLRREELFSEEPSSSDRLWANRGAIQEIQRLLRTGPYLVVWYQRFMAAQEDGKTPVSLPELEREFDPSGRPKSDPPQFDM